MADTEWGGGAACVAGFCWGSGCFVEPKRQSALAGLAATCGLLRLPYSAARFISGACIYVYFITWWAGWFDHQRHPIDDGFDGGDQ